MITQKIFTEHILYAGCQARMVSEMGPLLLYHILPDQVKTYHEITCHIMGKFGKWGKLKDVVNSGLEN
jgi:hypothetical protein